MIHCFNTWVPTDDSATTTPSMQMTTSGVLRRIRGRLHADVALDVASEGEGHRRRATTGVNASAPALSLEDKSYTVLLSPVSPTKKHARSKDGRSPASIHCVWSTSVVSIRRNQTLPYPLDNLL